MEMEMEKIRQIEEASIKILAEIGIVLHCPDVLEIVKGHGLRHEGNRVFFRKEDLLYWLDQAPKKFTLAGRSPQYRMEVGGDAVWFCPCSGPSTIADLSGRRRPGLMEDYCKIVKLYHMCESYHINGGLLIQPKDGPSHYQSLTLFASLLHSDKAQVTCTGTRDEMERLMEIAAIPYGGKEAFQTAPHVITIINSNTPLQYDKKMLETLAVFAENKQAVVIAAAGMAGTTSPITLAGTLALTNAEILAGIAVAQMIRPGTPVVYGSQTTNANMKTGSITIGSPEGALCYAYGAKLAKYYNLPCRGGGSLTDAKTLTAQAGYESMLTLLGTYQAKTNLIFQSSGIVDGYQSFSYEKFIVDTEIIGMVRRFGANVEVNEDTLAYEAISVAGIGGEFMSCPHTFAHLRSESFFPAINLSGNVSGDEGEKYQEKIADKLGSMLESHVSPALPGAEKAEMIQKLLDLGIDGEQIDAVQA